MTTFFPKPLDKQVAAISDSLSQTQDGLAIVANGNTHAAIGSGQFVYVKGHDTLSEGLYKATSAIDTNGTLSTSNLTPDGSGGLNDLQSQITSLNSNFTDVTTLYDGAFTTSNASYNLAESADKFMWIVISTNWYRALADNSVVIPSAIWITNEHLDIHRFNDSTAPYLRINTRANSSFAALVSDVGVHARIYGVGRLSS